MLLGRSLAALLCSALAAASVLKHAAPDHADADVEFSYGPPAGQVPVDDMRHYKAHDWPHPHRPGKDTGDKTIYQVLSADDEFSRFVKLIDISEEVVALLNSSSAGITLFALPDSALQFPKHKKGGHRHGLLSALSAEDPAALLDASQSLDLADVAAELDAIESASDDDDEKKERRKKIIKIIVRAILEYHILPQATDLGALLKNTTHGTHLTIPDGALGGEALRVRVGATLVPPAVRVNFYSTVVRPDVAAANGVIHVLDRPLLPPPSIFQALFLLPRHFGSLSSALQRVKLDNAVEWRYVRGGGGGGDGKWQLEGTASSTFFAPLNSAFQKLPWKLQLFLFSPFGERVLDRLLQFHVVPGFVLHSDYAHNATVGGTPAWVVDADVQGLIDQEEDLDEELFVDGFRGDRGKEDHKHRKGGNRRCKDRKGRKGPQNPQDPPHHRDGLPHHHPAPEYAANITLPTRLANHTVDVHVLKYRTRVPLPGHAFDVYTTRVFVNGQRVVAADVPARNGALHVVGRVLSPHPRHGKRVGGVQGQGAMYDSWADWEEWLVDWAEAN